MKTLIRAALLAGTALAFGCSGGGSGGTGTTGGGSTGGNGGSNGGSTGSAAAPSCEGFGVNASGTTIFADTYAFGFNLKTDGCQTTVASLADGTSIGLTGIFDEDLDGNDDGQATSGQAAPYAIFITDCDDLGQSGGVIDGDGGMNFTPPAEDAGVSSIASIVGSANPPTGAGVASVWGVVTAVNGWYYSTTDKEEKGGTVYIQDIATAGAPAPNSGISIYFEGCTASKGCANSVFGATPPTPPKRGDVVEFTGLTWSPYSGYYSGFNGYSNAQRQFSATKTFTMTTLGTAPLPPPVQLTPAQAAYNTTDATALTYQGMRATVSGGPFTVAGSPSSNDCPKPLQYASPSGG